MDTSYNVIETQTLLINPVIIEYLDNNYVLEQRDLLLQGLALVHAFMDEYDDTHIQVIIEDNDDPAVVDLEIREVIDYHLNLIVKSHHIVLSENVNLTNLIKIVSALYKVQFIEDYEYFLSIFDNEDTTNREKLCLILEHAVDLPEGYLIEVIDVISEEALLAFKTLALQMSSTEMEPIEGRDIYDTLLKVCELLKDNLLLTFYKLGIVVGKDIWFYEQVFVQLLKRYIENSQYDKYAKFYYMLLTLSDTDQQDFMVVSRAHFKGKTIDPEALNIFMGTMAVVRAKVIGGI